MLMTDGMIEIIFTGLLESLYMTVVSTVAAYILGLPLGIALSVTARDGLAENGVLYRALSAAINLLRSVPFVILMVAVIPLTRAITGTSVGSNAAIVPLVVAAAPYVARLVESSLGEIDSTVIEAARAFGASVPQTIFRVLLPEALPSLLTGFTIAITTILGYSAMAGTVGGGGLGSIAINYGYVRRVGDVLAVAVALLILLVWIFQTAGTFAVGKIDKRR